MKFPACLLLAAVLLPAAAARAERIEETDAVPLLVPRKPLVLAADTKTARGAVARLSFWVGRDGEVEAVELDCGDRTLFDEIVNPVLDWKFKGRNFTTALSFVRRGRRAWLVRELPAASRPKRDICSTGVAQNNVARKGHAPASGRLVGYFL